MHHIAHISCICYAYPGALPSFFTSLSKLTHHYNTRANFKKKMGNLEQENREPREEVSALKAGLANLTTLVEALVVAQNQPPSVQPQPTRENTEVPTVPVSSTLAVVQNRMPQGYPWGMPENFSPEVSILALKMLQWFRMLLLLHLLWCILFLLHLFR